MGGAVRCLRGAELAEGLSRLNLEGVPSLPRSIPRTGNYLTILFTFSEYSGVYWPSQGITLSIELYL